MTDAAPTTRPRPTWTRWLYPTLAATGIAVGLFVIVAGVYLLFFVNPSSGHSAQPDCCKSMEADMKKMMGDMAVKPTGERSAGEEIAGDVVQPKALSEIMKCAGRFHADTFKFGPERSVGAPAPLRVGS